MIQQLKIILPKLKGKNKEEDKERRKKIILIILILLLFFLFMLTVKDRLLSKPTTPEITSSSDEWNNVKTVEVEKDSHTTGKIAYYMYCISSTKSTKDCVWQKTLTKNVEVTNAGTSYIYFKAVDDKGHESSPSKPCVVNIDTEAPMIINVAKTVTETTIKLNVTAEDTESGIDKYYYKIGDNPYIESDSNEYTFENLTPNTEYTITVRVVDKVGNEKEVTFKVKTNNIGSLNNDPTNPNNNNSDNNNNNNNNNNNDNNNNGDDPNNDNPTNPEQPLDEIPEISLSGVPTKINYSDSYDLPTSYKFGPSGGVISCSVDKVSGYTNTNNIFPGDHVIKCTATSNTGTSVSVSKSITVNANVDPDEEWNGWIKMNLYYPENSTNWEWRLGDPSKVRTGNNNDMWKPYTGPITVKLDDVKKVFIRYTLNGKTITQTPDGSIFVDIEPDSYRLSNNETTEVKINYSADAEVVQYKINGGEWIDYKEPFSVPANTNISARAIKTVNIYDDDGNIISTQKEQSNDAVYISAKSDNANPVTTDDIWININSESGSLAANTTTKVTLSYASNPQQVQYQLNGGEWTDYTGEFEVGPNTSINAAITKDINTYNNTGEIIATNTQIETDNKYIYQTYGAGYTYETEDYDLSITASDNSIKADATSTITINYPEGSEYNKYQINNGAWKDYTGSFNVKPNTLITASTSKDVNVIRSDGEISSTVPRSKQESKYIYLSQMAPRVDYLVGPAISASPESLTTSVNVTITPQNSATKIYYQEENNGWQEYTGVFSVSKNETINAYYINAADGRTSDISTYDVNNIQVPSMPYIRFDSDHNLSTLTTSEIITITGSDYDKLEYSLDGVIYEPYTEGLTITNNCRIYAKATNANGVTTKYLNITNIGTAPAAPIIDQLTVSINPNPTASEVTGLINKLSVSINYDSRATSKKYRIGNFGEWQDYTGSFDLTSNTTIYAYATSPTGSGKAEYKIDYLTTGISDPIIKPDTTDKAYSVQVSIDFDRNASVKQYRIGSTGRLTDYTEPFEVDENTVIYAYSENALGNKSSSTYTISNIIKQPTYTVLDKGSYYILKVNYPTTAKTKEYKWTPDGTWGPYDETNGILLIKKEYASKLIGVDGVKITDDNGKILIYTKDYYVVNQPLTQLMENLFMRWDTVPPTAPTYTLEPSTPSKSTLLTINYDENSAQKKYKLVYNDGTETDWLDYTKQIVIDKNNTIVYAYSVTASEVTSATSSTKITNIDEIAPTIDAKGDFTTPARSVSITLVGNDNLKLQSVAYAEGEQEANYFEDNGTFINNNTAFTVTANGTYTIYAVDSVGNTTVKTINITNIDLTAPNITIYDKTANFGTQSTISIDYGDSTNKQYKIGTTGTYANYTGDLTLKSLDVAKYKNADNTITIYAKGKDTAGNTREISQVIYSLDVDVPASPTIYANATLYPTLTAYGFVTGGKASIIYDQSRDDLDNYYSLDGGTTWNIYSGPFENTKGTILAKSVKRSDNLTVQISKDVNMASDALPSLIFDNNLTTGVGSNNTSNVKYFNVDSKIWGSTISTTYLVPTGEGIYSSVMLEQQDSTGKILGTTTYKGNNAVATSNALIIDQCAKIKVYINFGWTFMGWAGNATLYEITLSDQPTITQTFTYPTMSLTGVIPGYNTININYYQTSTTRLYRIDGGNWINYTEPIKINEKSVLEAKGIDKYGKETIITKYTSAKTSDSLDTSLFDNDNKTGINAGNSVVIRYFNIDKSMWNKTLKVTYSAPGAYAAQTKFILDQLDANNNIIDSKTYYGDATDKEVNVVANAVKGKITLTSDSYCCFYTWSGNASLYEIKPNSYDNSKVLATPSLFSSFFAVPATTTAEKTFTAAPDITVSNSDVWSTSKDVTISYPSGYTNEYSLDGETWQAYTTSIKITSPTTIFARSMNGEEVVSSSSYQITKIDTTTPTISLDGVPTSINLGTDYSLPTSYTVDNTKSGGKAVCTINDKAYTSTSTLPLGKYDIKCTVTTGAGVIANATKSVEVVQEKVVTETTPAPIDSTTTQPTTQPSSSTTPVTEPSTTTKGDETNATTN